MENPMARTPLVPLYTRNTWELVAPGTFESVLRNGNEDQEDLAKSQDKEPTNS